MKTRETINALIAEKIKQDWILWGGNQHSFEEFNEHILNTPSVRMQYLGDAIVNFLSQKFDEK